MGISKKLEIVLTVRERERALHMCQNMFVHKPYYEIIAGYT